MAFHRLAIAAWMVLSLAALARAQVATVADVVAGPLVSGIPQTELKTLTRLYNSGAWDALQHTALELVEHLPETARKHIEDRQSQWKSASARLPEAQTLEPPALRERREVIGANLVRYNGYSQEYEDQASTVRKYLDPKANHIALLWVGADSGGKTQLMRVVVHRPSPAVFVADVPGLGEDSPLVELFLARTPLGRTTSVYASTRERDPGLEALPGFVQAMAGPLFQTFAAVSPVSPRFLTAQPSAAGPLESLPAPDPQLFATVSIVGLPFRRAGVKVKTSAIDPFFDPAGFSSALQRQATKLKFEEVSRSVCGRAFAGHLADYLPERVDARCVAEAPDLSACKAVFDSVLQRSYTEARDSCASSPYLKDDLEALGLVDKRFREAVATSLTNSVELEMSFKNRPSTRYSFGAGTALMPGRFVTSRPRAKLDSAGKVISDPVSRVLTMAFVNWAPWGYDSEAVRPALGETFRIFTGASLTPDFGLVGGVNVTLVRGIGVSLGYAYLFGKGAELAELNALPAEPSDPFRLSKSRSWFLGITYNYK